MKQTISSLMQRDVCSAGADDTLQTVESKMLARGLTWVPVVDESGAVLGVISSLDLLRFHADGKDAAKVCAWQICTYKPISVPPDASLSDVARLMVEAGIHHVVVMDGSAIKGVVSSLDFVKTFKD
ncbi:CBS domain-containing protein [Polaromonas naphthalenivorans]|uniref:Putative signal-transduction protein with CBS domains n=1 Tax=Polaromonas naphthalenivorans (strain CJ2) TaxID=365044 RepID=A1VP13_POLNA|nr:CBS domain-containing protein [Polaromonas naphthalenivorans]ABM37391.1 putative signal-transduction protein with CBS domains [Polaromonas naphthalenivorans CJ2]